MTTEELRALFPDVLTDEAIAARQAQAQESHKQSLRDQIGAKRSEVDAMEAELASIEQAELQAASQDQPAA